ncbi:MAG: GGDEF domain-containing protein [Betaproteobacteria bacterium HGW-Betaproteobacteria-1]|jgi:EAL domain-containing protein (putative c-di-GMP-specific phosphodiesterase class I)|nr:MAG: GGDEF domain-containing protein [Betaproteobacteria bacterium HGW-Betaproteobacteria-1]
MSLIKQLWIATIVLVVLVFSASLAAMVSTSRDYVVEQMKEKNIDNATSLALTMSQIEKDLVNLELLIAAQFDTGHYQLIRLSDPNGNLILERSKESRQVNAPAWFVQLTVMDVHPGYAQVQDGWAQYGRLRIESDMRIAYEGLWEASQRMFAVSLLVGMIGALIGSILLKRLLRPLNHVVQQAEAIGERRFVTSAIPKTKEFRLLVRTMNQLTERVRDMLTEETGRLEKLRLEANYDSTSGLMNRTYFFNRVSAMTNDEEDFNQGLLVVARLDDLSRIDKTLGHDETNALLHRMGQALQDFAEKETDTLAARLSGTDFAVFSGSASNAYAFASTIKGLLGKAIGAEASLDGLLLPTLCTRFQRQDKISDLYAMISTVIAEISQQSPDVLHVMEAGDILQHQKQDEAEWRQLLTQALEEKRLKLAYFPVLDTKGKVIHQESPVRMQLGQNDAWLPAGEFISWANRLELVCRIDVMVIEKALEALEAGGDDIALNISTRAICDEGFIKQVARLIAGKPDCARRLWLEVHERGAFEHLEAFRAFCQIMKPLGCKLGIEHVGANVSRLGELHDVGLDYIKIDVSVISGIDSNPGNQAFFRGLCLIARSIGLMSIAEGVQTEAEIKQLQELGVDGMTGPAIR